MRALVFLAALSLSAPAAAGVVSSSANGFEVRHTVNLVVPPQIAFAAFANLAAWWDPEHTYSGKSTNLSLELTPGGCFCERFDKGGGGVEHMRVAYVEPGKRVILTGSLGPLLYEATTGVMNVEVRQAAGGSQMTLDYKVAGFANGAGIGLAAGVDQMLGEQLKRYRAFATSRPRT